MAKESSTTARVIMLDYLEGLKWLENEGKIKMDTRGIQSNFPREKGTGMGHEAIDPLMPVEQRRALSLVQQTVGWLDRNIGDGEFFLEIAIHHTKRLSIGGFEFAAKKARVPNRRSVRQKVRSADREEARLGSLLECALRMWNAALTANAKTASQ